MLTTAQVAQQLAVTPQTVNALARAHGIGTLVNPRCRMFTPADVAKLKRAMGTGQSRTGRKCGGGSTCGGKSKNRPPLDFSHQRG